MQPQIFENQTILELLDKYQVIWSLTHLSNLAGWDLETYMPKKGASSRGMAMAKTQGVIQDLFLDQQFQDLIKRAGTETNLNDYESAVVRILEREREAYEKLPKEFIETFEKTVNESQVAWREARTKDDFSLFQNYLEKIVELNILKADYFGFDSNPYDALVDIYEEGATTAQLERYFEEIKPTLVELTKYISSSEKFGKHNQIEQEAYTEPKMKQLNHSILELLCWEPDRLRLDVSTHPFTQSLSLNDARITTRYSQKDFMSSLSSTIHEYGHGLYCIEGRGELEYTPLSGGISLGIHESQSRFWENLVGRSRQFCEKNLDKFHSLGDNFKQYSAEDFYHYFNQVKPGPIRVEADEVTYHSHIMIRFEIEKELINKNIKVADLPQIWKEKYESYLGITPKNDQEGVLQDIHWSMGAIGYFSTYSVGTVLSSQIASKLETEVSTIGSLIEEGKPGIEKIKNWLKDNLHQYGDTYTFEQFSKQLDNEQGFDTSHWREYLNNKYREIY